MAKRIVGPTVQRKETKRKEEKESKEKRREEKKGAEMRTRADSFGGLEGEYRWQERR